MCEPYPIRPSRISFSDDYRWSRDSKRGRQYGCSPRQVIESGNKVSGSVPLRDIIVALVIKQLCNLILVALKKLDSPQPLSTYGMDSMLAAEFRWWMYRIFKIDIPFLDLLSSSLSLDFLFDRIEKQVLGLSVLLASEEWSFRIGFFISSVSWPRSGEEGNC